MGNYVLSERAARALTTLIRGKAASSSPGYAPAAVSLDAFPSPFTVRWSQSENDGSGAWVIWLPDLAKLVQLDGAYLTLEGVTAATKLPTGWYTIDDDDGEATEVYCNVHKPTGSGSPSANISVDADTATTGESVIPVLVARMVTTESGAKLVKQFVDSSLILAGGAGDQVTPDDVSTEFCQHNAEPGADNTHEGELQVKGWNTGTPASASTLTANIFSAGTNQYGIVARRTDADHVGELVYLQPGSLNIDSNPLVVMSVDYVTQASDGGDFAAHPYAIRIKRGHLSYDPQNNILTVVEDVASKTFIDTRPLTQELS